MCSFLCSWDDSSSVSSGLSDTLDNLSTDDLNTTSSVSSYSNITASSRKNTHAQVSSSSLPFLATPRKACRLPKKRVRYQCLWNKWNTHILQTPLSRLWARSPWTPLPQPWLVGWHLRLPVPHPTAEGAGWRDLALPTHPRGGPTAPSLRKPSPSPCCTLTQKNPQHDWICDG